MKKIKNLPKKISVFPLSNFIIFPKTSVPLNIFEPRYIEMINDSMKSDRIIGMIQPKKTGELKKPDLHNVGCAGKITSFNETEDGRYLIILNGICRFKIMGEIDNGNLYRECSVKYDDYSTDLVEKSDEIKFSDLRLIFQNLKGLFKKQGYEINWKEIEKQSLDQTINTLSMASPFSLEEKQVLLESKDLNIRKEKLEEILNTYILDNLDAKVKIINKPSSIRNVSEKLYSEKYIRFMPNTIFTQNIKQIKKFLEKNKKIILKPIHSFSGNDIHLLDRFNPKLIKRYINKHGHIMCQKYLPKISNGDKRVFLINGKVVGAISRVPKKGSFLSNMSKGAMPIKTKLTKIENKVSKILAKDLKKEKIFFAGIDFIDQKLNGDINVTSPTGLKTLYELTKINLAKTFWKNLKA